jgi:hypothetical protein
MIPLSAGFAPEIASKITSFSEFLQIISIFDLGAQKDGLNDV